MTNESRPICNFSSPTQAVRYAAFPNRLLMTLLILAMTAAMVEVVVYQSTLEAQVHVQSDQLYGYNIIKPPLYYAAYAIQLSLSLLTGLVAMIMLDFRTVDRTYPLRLALLLGAAVLMTARSYTLSDLLSLKLVDATGPTPFFFFVLAFIGVNRRSWHVLDRVFATESVVLSGLVLLNISKLRVFSREESVLMLGTYLNSLLWPAAWVVLRQYAPNSWLRYVRFGPILVYSLGSVFVQTRLNFVMVLTLLFVYGYIQRKRGLPQSAAWLLSGALAVWAFLFVSIFLWDSGAYEKFNSVAGAFYSRLDEDTRTGQLYSFFRDVQPQELLLGRGSFATWNWNGILWTGGTDLGYLSLLLFGGVPLLAGYVLAQVLPSLRLFRRDTEEWQLPAAGVLFLFTIRMFSSSYPGQNLDSYILLLCTGACISRRASQTFMYHSRQPFPRVIQTDAYTVVHK